MGTEDISIGQEQIERIKAVLERAIALYQENPEKGEVYLTVKDTRNKDQEWTIQTKITEIVEGYAVAPDGEKIPIWSIDEVEMVDEE